MLVLYNVPNRNEPQNDIIKFYHKSGEAKKFINLLNHPKIIEPEYCV